MFSKKSRPNSKATSRSRRITAAFPISLLAASLALSACASDPRSMLPWGTYKYSGASALPGRFELPQSGSALQSAASSDLSSASDFFESSESAAPSPELFSASVSTVAYEANTPPDSRANFVTEDRIHYPAAVRGIQPPRMALPDSLTTTEEIWSDAVVARVNGTPILLSELKEAALDSDLPLTDLQLTGMSGETYRRSISVLVDDLLLVQEARREEIEPDEIEIGRRVDVWLTSVVDGMGGEEQFHRKLKTAGLDADSLRTYMVDRETNKTLSSRVISSRVTVSSQEVRDFVEARKASGQPQQEVKLAQILLLCPKSEQQTKEGRNIFYAAVELAQEAQAEPHRFAEIARDNSEDHLTRNSGGLLGWLEPESMRSYFRDRVLDMREGEVSEPIAGPEGFHVLYLAGRRTPRDMLYSERYTAERTRLVARLRNTAAIEIYPFSDYIEGPSRPVLPIELPRTPSGSGLVQVGLSND